MRNLEQQLAEKDKYTYTGEEVGKIEQNYDNQLAITEKALELACKEITGSCEYCSYKTRIECPVEADCLDEKINYFKSKAKEIINGYKQDD